MCLDYIDLFCIYTPYVIYDTYNFNHSFKDLLAPNPNLVFCPNLTVFSM